MGKMEKLKEMLVADPDDAFLLHALALEHIKSGDDAEARRIFTGILTRDPAYTGSYYHLGRLLERLGLPEEAKGWYEKGMNMAKTQNDRHAYNELQAALEDIADL